MKTNKTLKRITKFLNPIAFKVWGVFKSSEIQMATVLLTGIVATSLMIFHFTLENAQVNPATPVMQKQIIEVLPDLADD
ncbi:MAG: hypothetical protein GY869_20840 [Planctomycetes bacterium]|nr:hypothetical protein [Planctomycetota bacterium]